MVSLYRAHTCPRVPETYIGVRGDPSDRCSGVLDRTGPRRPFDYSTPLSYATRPSTVDGASRRPTRGEVQRFETLSDALASDRFRSILVAFAVAVASPTPSVGVVAVFRLSGNRPRRCRGILRGDRLRRRLLADRDRDLTVGPVTSPAAYTWSTVVVCSATTCRY